MLLCRRAQRQPCSKAEGEGASPAAKSREHHLLMHPYPLGLPACPQRCVAAVCPPQHLNKERIAALHCAKLYCLNIPPQRSRRLLGNVARLCCLLPVSSNQHGDLSIQIVRRSCTKKHCLLSPLGMFQGEVGGQRAICSNTNIQI